MWWWWWWSWWWCGCCCCCSAIVLVFASCCCNPCSEHIPCNSRPSTLAPLECLNQPSSCTFISPTLSVPTVSAPNSQFRHKRLYGCNFARARSPIPNCNCNWTSIYVENMPRTLRNGAVSNMNNAIFVTGHCEQSYVLHPIQDCLGDPIAKQARNLTTQQLALLALQEAKFRSNKKK